MTNLKHLQVVLKEFDSVVTPNKNVLIQYFWDSYRLSIRAQMNYMEEACIYETKLLKRLSMSKLKLANSPHLVSGRLILNILKKQDQLKLRRNQ